MEKLSAEQLRFLWDQVKEKNGDIWHVGELETGKPVELKRVFRRGTVYLQFRFQTPVLRGSDVLRTRIFSINTGTRAIKEKR
jgi:hypothetical protein